jgi:hypothetical protein
MNDRYLGLQSGRRDFLTRAMALGVTGATTSLGALLLLPREAQAGTIGSLSGEVRINGRIGGDAFFLRANSRLEMTAQGTSGTLISALRLVSGALGAAFYRGRDRRIIAPHVTAGIRGTGVNVEATADSTYFCTCYGAVDLAATQGATEGVRQNVLVVTGNHHARSIGGAQSGMRIAEALFINHSNAEMIALEALAGRGPLVRCNPQASVTGPSTAPNHGMASSRRRSRRCRIGVLAPNSTAASSASAPPPSAGPRKEVSTAYFPVKLAAIKFPGIVKNMYSVSFDLSLTAASLKVTFHSWPFLPSTTSTVWCFTACQDLSSLPPATSASLRWLAQPITVASEAGLDPWKWQLPPSDAKAEGAAVKAAIRKAAEKTCFMGGSFLVE